MSETKKKEEGREKESSRAHPVRETTKVAIHFLFLVQLRGFSLSCSQGGYSSNVSFDGGARSEGRAFSLSEEGGEREGGRESSRISVVVEGSTIRRRDRGVGGRGKLVVGGCQATTRR